MQTKRGSWSQITKVADRARVAINWSDAPTKVLIHGISRCRPVICAICDILFASDRTRNRTERKTEHKTQNTPETGNESACDNVRTTGRVIFGLLSFFGDQITAQDNTTKKGHATGFCCEMFILLEVTS